MIDTYSSEWRRICEARWVLRECQHQAEYMQGVKEKRGTRGYNMLARDVAMVRPHINNFTLRIAAKLIAEMKECESAASTNQGQ